MSSSDPRKGGNLTDWAEKGTQMPDDPSLQREIPSVPRPDQKDETSLPIDDRETAQRDFPPAAAADNPQDMPRSTKDMGPMTGEVVSGTGDVMPPEVESKRLNVGANEPGAKGSLRTFKHEVKNQNMFDRTAGGDPNDDAANKEHEFRNRPSS